MPRPNSTRKLYPAQRPGTDADVDWLYPLYKLCLRPAISRTWGWDEGFQTASFRTHLSPKKFTVLMLDGKDIGGFMLVEHADHLWLEMLLIHPEYQKKGIGAGVIQQLQRQAAAVGKPLKLCVIKANPVKGFYEKLGFRLYQEDGAMYFMTWPESQSAGR
jgi:GNAT superfamily N-acetyltransferase